MATSSPTPTVFENQFPVQTASAPGSPPAGEPVAPVGQAPAHPTEPSGLLHRPQREKLPTPDPGSPQPASPRAAPDLPSKTPLRATPQPLGGIAARRLAPPSALRQAPRRLPPGATGSSTEAALFPRQPPTPLPLSAAGTSQKEATINSEVTSEKKVTSQKEASTPVHAVGDVRPTPAPGPPVARPSPATGAPAAAPPTAVPDDPPPLPDREAGAPGATADSTAPPRFPRAVPLDHPAQATRSLRRMAPPALRPADPGSGVELAPVASATPPPESGQQPELSQNPPARNPSRGPHRPTPPRTGASRPNPRALPPPRAARPASTLPGQVAPPGSTALFFGKAVAPHRRTADAPPLPRRPAPTAERPPESPEAPDLSITAAPAEEVEPPAASPIERVQRHFRRLYADRFLRRH